jgi:hypothetical protein
VAHREVMEQNTDEEAGHYDDEDIELIRSLGLDLPKVVGVHHRDLYLKNIEALFASLNGVALNVLDDDAIAKPLTTAFEQNCNADSDMTTSLVMSLGQKRSDLSQ